MSTRNGWRLGFLTVTLLAIVMELVAAFDGDPQTDPWTNLIVTNVPAPVTYTAIGVLCAWLPVHFAIRYRRRAGDRPARVRYEGTRRPGPPPSAPLPAPPPAPRRGSGGG